jgi:hypothetical protein
MPLGTFSQPFHQLNCKLWPSYVSIPMHAPPSESFHTQPSPPAYSLPSPAISSSGGTFQYPARHTHAETPKDRNAYPQRYSPSPAHSRHYSSSVAPPTHHTSDMSAPRISSTRPRSSPRCSVGTNSSAPSWTQGSRREIRSICRSRLSLARWSWGPKALDFVVVSK